MSDEEGDATTKEDPRLTFEEISQGIWVAEFLELKKDPEHNVVQAEYFKKRLEGIFKGNPTWNVNFLIDATNVKNARIYSREARAKYLRMYTDPRVSKVAFVGLGPALNQMVRIFAHFVGRWSTSRIFHTREEAIQWLKSDD